MGANYSLISLFVQNGKPDIAKLETTVLRDGVMFLDLQRFSDSPLMPVGDTGDQVAFIPENSVIMCVCMIDDCRLVPLVSPTMGLVFLNPDC